MLCQEGATAACSEHSEMSVSWPCEDAKDKHKILTALCTLQPHSVVPNLHQGGLSRKDFLRKASSTVSRVCLLTAKPPASATIVDVAWFTLVTTATRSIFIYFFLQMRNCRNRWCFYDFVVKNMLPGPKCSIVTGGTARQPVCHLDMHGTQMLSIIAFSKRNK